jgi:pyrroloquinoline quinone (PQQ) biosynthesis protein C
VSAATELIAATRAELAPTAAAVRDHAYVKAILAGEIPRDRLSIFAGEQYQIIKNDMRSFAVLLSRQADADLRRFLLASVEYESAAFDALVPFAEAVGLDAAALEAYQPLAGAHAYTAFLALTAMYGSAAEMAAAFVIDLEGWGGNCRAMSAALKARYGLTPAQVRFFDHFGAEDTAFEGRSLAVVEAGLAGGVDPNAVRRTARLMLEYELLYWDTVYAASRA